MANDGVGMSSAIFQEMGDGFGGFLCSLCLGGCKGAKGDEEDLVDGTSIVQEHASDLLDFSEARSVQGTEF